MPPPTNTLSGTATVIASLPYALNQNVHDAGTTYTVWYTYTPTYTGVLGVWGFGGVSGYLPTIAVWHLDATEIYHGITGYPSRPIQIPVTEGHQIWIRFTRNSTTVTPAVLTGQIQAFSPATSPIGSIFVNDASSAAYLTALLNPVTGAPTNLIADFPGGEQMTQLADGLLLVEDLDTGTLKIYTGALALVATIPRTAVHLASNPGTASTPGTRFYVGHTTSSATPNRVETISATGTVGSTVWTLPSAVSSLSPSRDDTILYYAGGAAGDAVKRWDLVGSVGLSDLAAGVGGSLIRELFVLADGTVLALYRTPSAPYTAVTRRYSAAGALLNTYTTQFAANTGSDPHLALAGDDPLSFWAWYKTSAFNSRFLHIETASGTILQQTDAVNFTSGYSNQPTTATPSAYFGHSESCTFVVTRVAIPPSTTSPPGPGPGPGPGPTPIPTEPEDFKTRTHTRRRLRTFPHLSEEQVWAFHHSLQIDMETGVGLVDPTDQGHDPTLMLRWSDDGGHTWSNIHTRGLGAAGAYRHRIIYRALGRSRDRIYEISMSDPVRANVIAAYLDAEAGG